MVCIHGHPFVENSDVCVYGHAGPDDPENPPGAQAQFTTGAGATPTTSTPPTTTGAQSLTTPTASLTDMQNLLTQMLTIQNNSLLHTPSSRTDRSKTKPERPTIKHNSTDGDWQLYNDSWLRYKQMCKITDPVEVRNELRCTCSHEVNQLLFDIVGPEILNSCSESQLLEYIKSVAVQGSHKEVHRQKFQALKQEEGQLVTHFLAKLKSQAQLCDFNVNCPNPLCGRSVSYTTNMVAGQLIAGLHNSDHQARVLAEAASLTTLQAKFDRLVSLETTDLATRRLNMTVSPGTTSATNAMNSNFRGQRQQHPQQRRRYQQSGAATRPPRHIPQQAPHQQPHQQIIPCKGCGQTVHTGKTMRRADCPAFNHICENCGIRGHHRAPRGLLDGEAKRAEISHSPELVRGVARRKLGCGEKDACCGGECVVFSPRKGVGIWPGSCM